MVQLALNGIVILSSKYIFSLATVYHQIHSLIIIMWCNKIKKSITYIWNQFNEIFIRIWGMHIPKNISWQFICILLLEPFFFSSKLLFFCNELNLYCMWICILFLEPFLSSKENIFCNELNSYCMWRVDGISLGIDIGK